MADLDVGDYDTAAGHSFPPPALHFSPPPPSESTSPSAGGTSGSGGEAVGLSTIAMVFAMVLYMSVGHRISHSSKYIGEGMAAALTGLMLGFILLLFSNIFISEETLQQLLSFDHSSFFTFYLPPIILFAGLSVRKKAFFKQLPTIASLGIAGTYIAFALIAALMFAVSKFIHGITLADCLALGAIFATTDSVAVLQVLEQDRAPLLFSFVFGEGVINDATTVALLRTVQGLGITPRMDMKTVLIIFGKFIYLFAISMVMGLAFGFGASLLLKKYTPSGVPQAVGLVGTTAYMSYLVSDHLGLSGIVTLFCCSVCMSHYALHSLTKTQRAATLSSFETLSYLAEGSIFVYVGLDALDPEKWADTNVGRAVALSVIVIIVLLFSRAVFCFPVLAVHNYFSTERVNTREMFICWWAGGMRGAVSVALVYFYYDSDSESGCGRDCATLISMTLLVVLVSTLVFGAVTKPLLDFMLGVEVAPSESSAAGLEMVPDPLRYKGKADVLRLGDTGPLDSGYETDGTAFSDAGYTTEDDGNRTPLSEAQGLLQDMEAGESAQPGLRLQASQAAFGSPQTRLPGSILKGLAPRALIASPEGSPRAGEGDDSWNTLAEVQGMAPSGLQAEEGQEAGALAAAGQSGPVVPRERPHVKFSEHNERREYRPTSPLDGTSTSGMRRANSADDLAAGTSKPAGPPPPLRMPLRLGGRRPQTIQLAEWWADFDEKFMRPVFSRDEAVSTPPTHGHHHGFREEHGPQSAHRRGASSIQMASAASTPLPPRRSLPRPKSESDFGASAVWTQPESDLPASSAFRQASQRPGRQ